MKKVFLTGITGLLGSNLIVRLLAEGYEVTALVRDPTRYKGPQSEHLRLVKGSLQADNTSLLKDIDVVIHTAAETATHLRDYGPYHAINCVATRQLFDSAIQAKVKRFIFVSTANTIGYGSPHTPGTEALPMQYPFTKLNYALSKKEAEAYLQMRSHLLDVVILHPTFLIGALDSKPSSGRLILAGLGKKWIFYPPGGKNIVYVKDVVQAILQSFTHGRTGESYLVCGDNMSFKEFFRILCHLSGQKSRLIPVPRFLLRIVGFIGDTIRFFGINTSLSTINMKALCTHPYYSNQRSREELNMQYHSTETAVAEAIGYFRERKKP